MNQSNQGFINLHNPEGILLVTFAGFLLLMMIVFGVVVARIYDQKAKEQRAALRESLRQAEENQVEPKQL